MGKRREDIQYEKGKGKKRRGAKVSRRGKGGVEKGMRRIGVKGRVLRS